MSRFTQDYILDDIDCKAITEWNKGREIDAVKLLRYTKCESVKEAKEYLQDLLNEYGKLMKISYDTRG